VQHHCRRPLRRVFGDTYTRVHQRIYSNFDPATTTTTTTTNGRQWPRLAARSVLLSPPCPFMSRTCARGQQVKSAENGSTRLRSLSLSLSSSLARSENFEGELRPCAFAQDASRQVEKRSKCRRSVLFNLSVYNVQRMDPTCVFKFCIQIASWCAASSLYALFCLLVFSARTWTHQTGLPFIYPVLFMRFLSALIYFWRPHVKESIRSRKWILKRSLTRTLTRYTLGAEF